MPSARPSQLHEKRTIAAATLETSPRAPGGPRAPVSLARRLRLALRHEPKRLLYPILALGRGRVRAPAAEDLASAKRALLVRELYTIGDALVATPAVRALAASLPGLELGLVAGWRNGVLWRHNPRVSRLFTLARGPKARQFAALAREIRAWRPDVFLTLESLRCHATHDLLARASGAPVRIRYEGARLGGPHTDSAYNRLVRFAFEAGAHQIDVCAGVLAPFGIALADRRLELVPGPKAEARALAVLERAGVSPGEPFVVVHPGSKQVHNRWPLERFLGVHAHCRGRSLRALFSLGPSERESANALRTGGAEERDLLPPLAVDELAAVLRQARLLVCPDTGVLHVGAAVGVPIVGLYGSGDPEIWRPPGPVRVVSDHARGNVRGIALERVLAEVEAALAEPGAGGGAQNG